MFKIDWDFLIATAAWLAARTETLIDDRAVDLAKAIKADPVLQTWFGAQTPATEIGTDGTLKLIDEPPAEIVQALFDGGVFKGAKDFADVMAAVKEVLPYLLELVQFIRLLTGK